MIELCPNCNATLSYEYLCVMPPIEVKRCKTCNSSWYKTHKINKTIVFNPEGWEKA